MIRLLATRDSKTVLKNGLCSVRRTLSSDNNSDARTSETNTNFQHCFENEALSVTLPDLSSLEEAFVKQQVQISLQPDCLKKALEIVDENGASVGFGNPTVVETVFPPPKGMLNMVVCCNQIAKVYPSFKVPRRSTDRFGRNMTSPTMSQRIAEGLHLCGIREQHLEEAPDLVLNSSPNYVAYSVLATMLDIDLGSLKKIKKGKILLRGNFIHAYLNILTESLRALDFSDEAEKVSNISFRKMEAISLRDFYFQCSLPIFEGIAQRSKFNVDVGSFVRKISADHLKAVVNPIDLVRNFHIMKEILCRDPSLKKSTRAQQLFSDYIILEPLESLVTINSLHRIVSSLNPHYSSVDNFLREFQSVLSLLSRSPPNNLPLIVRKHLLQDIGFDNLEVMEILASSSCARYSDVSTSLHYNSTTYVSKMKERLDVIRSEPNLRSLPARTIWNIMTNWSKSMQELASVTENYEPGQTLTHSNGKIVTSSLLDYRSSQHPTIKFLSRFFGCSSADDVEKLIKLSFPCYWFKSVPLDRIKSTLNVIIARGFNNNQIRSSIPLLFYPSSLVTQTLNEIERDRLDLNRDLILPVCLYCIEKEFNFTSDGLLASTTNSSCLSEKFRNEMNKYKKLSSVGTQTDTSSEEHLFFLNESRMMLRPTSVKARLFSTSANFSHLDHQQRQFSTSSIYSLLRFSWRYFKVYGDIVSFKRDWDPNFSSKDFLKGSKEVGNFYSSRTPSEKRVV